MATIEDLVDGLPDDGFSTQSNGAPGELGVRCLVPHNHYNPDDGVDWEHDHFGLEETL